MGRVSTILLALALLGPGVEAKDKSAEANSLLETATQVSLLREDGRPPFRLRGKVNFLKDRKVVMEGEYSLQWASPMEWREEVRFPDYEEVRIADSKRVWTTRSEPLSPGRIWQTSVLFDYGAALRLDSNLNIRGIGDEKRDGKKLRCIRLKREREKGEVCFHREGRYLVAAEGPQDGRTEYDNFGQVGEFWYPRTMRFLMGRRPIIEVRVEEISLVEGFEEGTFAPPSDAHEILWCPDPSRPRLLLREEPRLPRIAAMTLKEGAVEFLVRVGPNGYTRVMETISSSGPEYRASAVDAVRRWQYDPARCDAVPVESQVAVEVEIRIR